MTIGTQMHQTLTSLEGAVADLKTYALQTEDKNAKKQFTDYANQLDSIAQGLKGRVNYLESQEPQYKVFQKAQQPQQQ
ncbi:DUF1657 domain-containing protein [Neomoorella thermoacetica]|uniref:DUF1657 domain-containing protein n=3 Tax=Neomoorella thermoacetica TaxID=1525 RepID=A0A1D7XC89_NEOTH|nr:DUF1657 domain-containing protein [Moorella thermoacetica]AKX94593.1 hypothetical protein MOTHE_c18010 [Moorella thermoacetica]AKX97229.1 hypothetical protein MOTHA_c18840 [Moorella thermoacetica]AOQ24534.1 hypothetical protein Maut_02100 [Moorella thermoacetica]APC08992.1 hypothetical protein MTJW_18340 [Moorella thermoacetica]OIQ09480.1 hypothetical protein MOOR_08640 [Moorella thermoacetica]